MRSRRSRSISVPDVRERIDHLMVRVVCADRERRAEENLRRFGILVELLALFQVDEDRAWRPIGSFRTFEVIRAK